MFIESCKPLVLIEMSAWHKHTSRRTTLESRDLFSKTCVQSRSPLVFLGDRPPFVSLVILCPRTTPRCHCIGAWCPERARSQASTYLIQFSHALIRLPE